MKEYDMMEKTLVGMYKATGKKISLNVLLIRDAQLKSRFITV